VATFDDSPASALAWSNLPDVWTALVTVAAEQGQVIALAQHSTGATMAWLPDWEATKLK
jgi:hypothetical protein